MQRYEGFLISLIRYSDGNQRKQLLRSEYYLSRYFTTFIEVLSHAILTLLFDMKHLFILLIALLGYNTAKADCPSCWELRKVEITLKSGSRITGYIKWNESWLDGVVDTVVWKNRFPESLLAYYENLGYKWDLEIYEEIYLIKNDSINPFVASKPEKTGALDYEKIKAIKELGQDEKIYRGRGEILTFTQEEISKMMTNPFGVFYFDSAYYSTWFLSYNKYITAKELSRINEDNLAEKTSELRKKGVIVITFGF